MSVLGSRYGQTDLDKQELINYREPKYAGVRGRGGGDSIVDDKLEQTSYLVPSTKCHFLPNPVPVAPKTV
jgi:hypothetical protein